jgi:uncharacterized protein YegL
MSAFSTITMQSYIALHSAPFPEGVEINKGPDHDSYTYGTLNISAGKASISTRPTLFRFTTDCSGSMSDVCKDGRTKMEHIRHTMVNMLHYFADNEDATIFVQVSAFDDKIHEIIPTTEVTKANIGELVVAVNKMRPMNSTDIELALKDAALSIHDHLDNFPDHSVSHVFMTDGDATTGNFSPDYLASLVGDNCSNTFIAFGLQHNVAIMQALGKATQNSSNWLIDKLENAGLVYGEILNNELFKVFEEVEVTMTNGVIYDYKTGMFVDKLYIGTLVTEVKKVYHVLALDRDVDAKIVGRTAAGLKYSDIADCVPDILDSDGNVVPCDLTEQIFRLKAQQLMFEAKDFAADSPFLFGQTPMPRLDGGLKRQNAIPNFNDEEDDLNLAASKIPGPLSLKNPRELDEEEAKPVQSPMQIFRKNLGDFLEIMKNYMKDQGKEEDPFMMVLCDDIYLTIRSLGTFRQKMCIAARESSQGRQQCYNVSDFDFDSMPMAPRGFMDHTMSRAATNTAYQTPSAIKLMRTCSAPMRTTHQSDDDEQELEA